MVTVSPSLMVCSSPASTLGDLLDSGSTVTSTVRQLLPFSKTFGPEAVTFTVYVPFSTTEVMLSRLPPVISKMGLPPATMSYEGEWALSGRFCADILPMTPGTSGCSMVVELSVMYQFPRF